eukprot:TRINITY_DN2144_c0_g1_i2.p1 TRINITY_DN2144_c0_g1~~TRINITY_DN2144_c0_g1_i2.p1  ORF type:complete len:206 (+),score=35.54 TRINITY_DN2144_c0_g1_i2:58-675(+)
MSEEDPKIFKIIVVGDSGVGKTCLIKQFTQHIFYESNQSTISTDLGMRDEIINGKPTKLHIWDTAGQEQYRSIVTAYYRNSYGAIIVFDMTRRDSFQNANTWLQELKKHAGDQVRVILVGNKADCEYMRAVTTKEAEEYAEYYNLLYYETSAKTSLNVDKVIKHNQKRKKKKKKLKIENYFKDNINKDIYIYNLTSQYSMYHNIN